MVDGASVLNTSLVFLMLKLMCTCGPVAQWLEHQAYTLGVEGSNPSGPTNLSGMKSSSFCYPFFNGT